MLNTSNDECKLLPNFDLLFATTAQAPGGVARLRELILTLAVQGKLVAQDKENVEADIATLKGTDFPDAPYTLPKGWDWVRLGSVTSNMGSGWSPACINEARASDNIWAVLKTTAVQINKFHPEENKVLPSNLQPRPDIEAKHGDVLITRAGPMNRVGICCYVDKPIGRLMLSDKIVRFTPDLTIFIPEFFMLCLNSGWTKYLIENSKSGMAASQVNISQKNIKDLWVPVCSLAEQSRIVTRVEELMRLCDALEEKGRLEHTQHQQLLQALLDSLTQTQNAQELARHWQRLAQHFDLLIDRPEAVDALEQTILQLAVRGLLVEQDASDEPASELLKKVRAEKDQLIAEGQIKKDKPLLVIGDEEKSFDLPQDWCFGRLEDISLNVVDCPHSTPKFIDEGYLCLDTNSFKKGALLSHKFRYVSKETFLERNFRLEPKAGDLVFAREGAVGESVLIPAGVDACLGQRVMLFRFSENVSNEFVQLAISSASFLDGLLALHKGIGAKHVNVGDMRKAVIPLPPLAEQSRIVARVTELRALCQRLRDKLTQARRTQTQLAQAWVEQAAA